MTPFLADGIDIPMVLVAGIIVLVPLMAFEVFVEALVLKPIWRLPYGRLCTFTLVANVLSLLAGIPTKVFNAFMYAHLLPEDIPGFFARYPFVVAIGSLVYFAVTLLVEGAYALHWRRRKQPGLARSQILRGILWANVATYVVLAPLNYYATRPWSEIREFTTNTRWASRPSVRVIFTDSADHYLKSARLDGSEREIIVPAPVSDFLLSSNLSICLFRGTNGNLYLYRRNLGTNQLIWKTDERFFMNQVAFSPSGDHVAYASQKDNSVEVVDVSTGRRSHLLWIPKFSFDGPSLAWSREETKFFVRGFDKSVRLAVTISPAGALSVSSLDSNAPPVLTCYGRTGDSRWWGGGDWGVTYNRDSSGDLTASVWPGLDSGLRIYREDQQKSTRVLTVSVRPGLFHLALFDFGDVAFLEGTHECVFESNGYIYLLDVNEKRIGTLVHGDRFILLTARYKKTF